MSETTVNVPEGLPTLAAGDHQPGDGKACVMEYVALLAGEQWTDSPRCTHKVLAQTAQAINDALADDQRHLLIPFIGRLFGTNRAVDLGPWVAAFSAVGNMKPDGTRGGSHCNWPEGSSVALRAAWLADDAVDALGFFSALIDEYDRLTGRTTHREVTTSELTGLRDRVASLAATA